MHLDAPPDRNWCALGGGGSPVGPPVEVEPTKLSRTDHFHHLPGYVRFGGALESSPFSSVRDGRWKLYYNYTDNSFELYDLVSDISETADLAAKRPGLAHQLGERLITWLDETDAPLATLRAGRPTRVLTGFVGETYAHGEVTQHHGDTITIRPGEQVPFILPRP